jgi:hypothetical protein
MTCYLALKTLLMLPSHDNVSLGILNVYLGIIRVSIDMVGDSQRHGKKLPRPVNML